MVSVEDGTVAVRRSHPPQLCGEEVESLLGPAAGTKIDLVPDAELPRLAGPKETLRKQLDVLVETCFLRPRRGQVGPMFEDV